MTTPDLYFIPDVRYVFDDYFAGIGTSSSRVVRADTIEYLADHWFASFSYEALSGPNYPLWAGVGPLPCLGVDPAYNQIQVWRLIPQESEQHNCHRLRYSNSGLLREALVRLRDEVFTVHVGPWLADPAKLRLAVEEHAALLRDQFHNEVEDHNAAVYRCKAELAFQNSDYDVAVENYGRIPPDKRSKVDTAKLELARKRAK